MHRTLRSLAALLLVIGCDDVRIVPPGDAGVRMDAGTSDAGPGPLDAGGATDAGMDGGTPVECGAMQHRCDDTCVDLLPNNPANGCALGCGDPCPNAGAVCNPDGTCGEMGCEPMTCESLGVECGVIDNGCGGRRSCGSCDAGRGETCVDGSCVILCSPDPLEPNDTSASATALVTLTDEPDSSARVTNGTIHRVGDVDWYRATVMNNCCFGDPVVTVRLNSAPAGETYQLGAWYQCSAGNRPTCTTGTSDTSVASGGCVSSGGTVAFNTNCDPHGVLFVRVQAPSWGGSCGAYDLEVLVR